ncbi:MAG: ketol-acid reductoisomerase [Candidatus Omnitrophica bacterium CG1_02_46_14]|nr:MAG: ketol-acid reductoisomerase [Candidatus Omnitrophica bacterium CG1_02_46_14]
MAKVYYDNDADISYLKNKTVGVIGYGIQGRGQALNLRDSGVNVLVSQRSGGPNFEIAKTDGFEPLEASELAKRSDVIIILTQDPLQAEIYEKSVKPFLTKDKALAFSHGFNIRFKEIVPPKFVDVFMVAPKGPGSLVRRLYEEGKGVPCLVAVYQDASKNCKQIALAYAKGLGGTRAGVIETTFKEETETDLFGEQVVLCGGVSALIKAGFETLVAAGYQPEIAYFECLHELKLITDMIYATGIQGMRKRVSDTAEYGDLTRGPRVVNEKTKKEMKKILKEIQNGKFAKEFVTDYHEGKRNFEPLRHADDNHLVEQVGVKLRGMMKWL